MKLRYIAFALATVAAAPAVAAPVSGARVEGVIGYDHSQLDLRDFGGPDEDAGGLLYGVGVGYDFLLGPGSSVGIDAEITDATTDLDFVDGTDSAELKVGRDLYVGGRFTTAISEGFNLYGKAGYTNARVKARATSGGVTVSDSGNADGFRIGVGGQFAIGANSYVGTEYRYSNYEGDFSRHQLAATFGVRF